jgi:hypothetical protein
MVTLPPGKEHPVHIEYEVKCAHNRFGCCEEEKNDSLPGMEPNKNTVGNETILLE